MKEAIYDGDEFLHKGHKFVFTSEPDQEHSPPWKNDDGCGIVSAWRHIDTKRPGERVLNKDGGSVRFYDWQATMKKARKDGWGVSWESENRPEQLNEFKWKLWYAGLTVGEKAALAVEQDFQRMRAWCNDDWRYIGIIVTHVRTGRDASLWGIESDCLDYHREVAKQLADEIMFEVRSSHQKAG